MSGTPLAFWASLAVALVATPLCKAIAWRTSFLAHPSERGIHRRPTPLLGGVAVFLAFVVGATVAGILGLHPPIRILGFVAGGFLIFVMGVVDDRVSLSWSSKLVGQSVAAVLLLASGNTGAFPLFDPPGLLLSLFWIVGLTNAFNFLDNMDGITAGIAAVASLSFAGIALLGGQLEVALLSAALCGAAIGFLRYNFHPAQIFLGDGGSLFLGYTLAGLGLMITHRVQPESHLLIPVLVLAYPIFDISFVSVTRYARGQSLTQGGKDHTSHRLARLRGGARATSWLIYVICLFCGATALLLDRLAFPPATIVVFVVAVFGFIAFGNVLCRRAPVSKSAEPRPSARAVS